MSLLFVYREEPRATFVAAPAVTYKMGLDGDDTNCHFLINAGMSANYIICNAT